MKSAPSRAHLRILTSGEQEDGLLRVVSDICGYARKDKPMTTDNMQAAIDALHVRIDALAERLETSLSPSLNQIMWGSIAHLDDQVQHNAQVRSCSYANLDALRARAATLEDVLARQSGRLQDLEKQVWAAGNEIEDLLERQQAVENLAGAYRERLERLENNHQASLDNLARRLERAEKNLWPTVAAVAAETSQPADSLATAIKLLMRCVPVLDLQISNHNDCHRLRRAICGYLADAGYPGWLSSRGL